MRERPIKLQHLRSYSNLASDQYFRSLLWIVEKYLLEFFHIDGVDVAVGESTDMHHTLAFDGWMDGYMKRVS